MQIFDPVAPPLFFALAVMLFYFFRNKAVLMFFQQEEYDMKRFPFWILDKKAYDKRASLMLLAGFAITPLMGNSMEARETANLLFMGAFLWGAWISHKTVQNAKKKLVMTTRAKRIFILSLVLLPLFLVGLAQIAGELNKPASILIGLLLLQLPPAFIMLANLLLSPIEKHIKARYLNEARDKIARLNPTVIGITGSYGKTSTKHILAHILSTGAPTLATPGSVNTEMGITRIIREELNERHKYFIVEMGAYGEGSIARLCRLTPPKLGILTSIGLAHRERFGSIEAVTNAKFELADAAIAGGGRCVVNISSIPDAAIEERVLPNANQFITAAKGADDQKSAWHLGEVETGPTGLSFSLKHHQNDIDNDIRLTCPVFGEHQAENIMLAVAAATELGFPPETIAAALKTLPQTQHRLELHRSKSGASILDDAYNSNPRGFEEALKTLDAITQGRRILVTPGMVELGDAHDAEHEKLGAMAARLTDLCIVVTPERIPSFVKGFNSVTDSNAELMDFATQDEADAHARAVAGPGDIILYENNLPDLFEAKVRF